MQTRTLTRITRDKAHSRERLLLGLLTGVLIAPAVMAQDAVDPIIIQKYTAETILQGDALNRVSGATGVNMAAGDNNLQSNSGAIAIGTHAYSQNNLIQESIANGFTPDKASTSIQGQAFNNSSGWMAINQAAGQGNAQSNAIGIAAGLNGRVMTDDNLGQILSGQQELTTNPDNADNSNRLVEIDGSAFNGARGIIQVNQSAGTENATSNSFQLRMGVGN